MNRFFKKKFIFFLLCLSGCITSNTAKFDREILGSWAMQDEGDNEYGFSHTGFLESGRKCVIVYEIDENGFIEPLFYDSKWEIKDKYLVTTAVKNTTSFFEPGDHFRDEILLMKGNDLKLLFISNDDWFVPEEEKYVRLKDVPAERICQIVEENIK